MTVFALFALVSLPTVRQIVEVDCPDDASAASATAEVVMMGEGERFVFSGRWDDRNPRSLAVAKALSPLGFHSTFYTSGKSSANYTPILRELVALGNSIGCHTISHGFMSRFLPVKIFREILENRIELEVDSQSPVAALALPFGMHAVGSPVLGFDNVKVIGTAASNAGLLGGAQKPDNATALFGLSDDDWAGTYKFGANDRKPNEKTFWQGFRTGTNLVARGELPGGPNVNLGTHPWQTDEGLLKLAAMVKEAMATPGAVMMHENGYIASRIQFRRATVRKAGTKDRRAIFEIERPNPAVLGAAVPLNLKLSDGRILKVAPPEGAAVPTVFERIDGVLAVSDDESTFTLDFTNTTGRTLADVSCALRLPPGYAPGVVWKSVPSIAAGEGVRFVFSSAAPENPLFREGTLYAAVEINVPGRRIWAPLVKERAAGACAGGPRDTVLIRSLVPVAELPPAEELAAWSDPAAKLDGDWHPADGSPDGDAPWAVTGFRKTERGLAHKLPWSLPAPGTGKASVFVFDFTADTAAHGEAWECFYAGGQLPKERVCAWLNGAKHGFPSGKMALRNGKNRLVVLMSGLNYKMLFTMIAIRSAKDGASVLWTKNRHLATGEWFGRRPVGGLWTPESQGLSSRAILKWVDHADRTGGFQSFVLMRHGKTLAEGWWSPCETNGTHLLYSLSKSFTSTAVGMLADEGRLDLDERLADIFPESLPPEPSANLLSMRVRDLLTMTTGHTNNSFKAFATAADGDWRRERHQPAAVLLGGQLGVKWQCETA